MQPRTVSFVVNDGAVANNLSSAASRIVLISSASNVAPTFVAGNLTFSYGVDSNTAMLSANDSDPLTYSADIDSVGHFLRTTYNLTHNPGRFNKYGQNEQWFTAPGINALNPTTTSSCPTAISTAPATRPSPSPPAPSCIASARSTTTSHASSANRPAAAPSHSAYGRQLTFDNPTDDQGQFIVTATVSDGAIPVTKSFFVNFTNLAPMLAPIANQTMPDSQNNIQLTLSASDLESDTPLIYSATVQSQAQLLDNQYNFISATMPGAAPLVSGANAGSPAVSPSPSTSYPTAISSIGTAHPTSARAPSAPTSAPPITPTPTSSSIPSPPPPPPSAAPTSTVDPNINFKGTLVVTAKVTDPRGNFHTQTFNITVDPKPTLAQPNDVASVGTTPIAITLSATDPYNLPLTYRVTNEAAVLQATYGLAGTSQTYTKGVFQPTQALDDAGRLRRLHVSLADGRLYSYDTRSSACPHGSGPRFNASTRENDRPPLLHNPRPPHQRPRRPGHLHVRQQHPDRDSALGFTGKLVLTVYADNGAFADAKTFTITVS